MSQIIKTQLSRLAAFEILVGASTATRTRIIPFGLVQSANGPFTLDDEGARKVIEDFQQHGVDLIVDWDHMSLYVTKPGDSKAAGWIRHPNGLEYVPGEGIFATIEWTQEAAEAIRKQEYKYLSPTIYLRQTAPPRVVGLDSVGLVNKPAIPDMPALAASRNSQPKEIAMNEEQRKELLAALKAFGVEVPDTADGNAVLMECKKVFSTVNAHDVAIAKHVRSTLGLQANASKDAVEVCLAAKLDAAAKNESDLAAMRKQSEEVRKAESQKLFDAAVSEGRINPNGEKADTLKKMAIERPEEFKVVASLLPPNPAPGLTKAPAETLKGGDEDRMIENAKKECGGKFGDALELLQRRLVEKEIDGGCTRGEAIKRLQPKYPKIFG